MMDFRFGFQGQKKDDEVKDQLQTDRVVFQTSDTALNTCSSGGESRC